MKPLLFLTLLSLVPFLRAQEPAAAAKPTEHVLGTVTAVDKSSHTVTIKADGDGSTHAIELKETKTLIKVPPGAKDLKSATRITADDLAVGDRIEVRGSKSAVDPSQISARSVVLMSGRDLQQVHQAEASAWQHSTSGIVTSVDAAGHKLSITTRTAEGSKPMTVDASAAEFTRYSPETPKVPGQSSFAEIQTGDQVKIIGEKSADEQSLTAQKVYSGSFKSVAGTLVSAAPDGKSMVIKDLQSKQPVTISLGADSAIRKLPPMMAMMLARRFNPDFKAPAADPKTSAPAPGGSGAGKGSPAMGAKSGEAAASSQPPRDSQGGAAAGGHTWNGQGGGRGPANGDLGQMLERVPAIALSDLKPGDAVVVSGSPSAANKSVLLAANVIAGVEPIFQSASPRQAQSLGDWGNLGGGAAMDMGVPQ